MSEEAPPLAPLQVASLDDAKLDDLFTDLEALAVDLEVTLRHQAVGGEVSEGAYQRSSLSEARASLRAREVLGVKIRYAFGGARWWDTLIPLESGARLVRMKDT